MGSGFQYGAPQQAMSQIGDLQFMPDSGTLITKPNGEVWLRGGSIASSAIYPAAATLEHMMVHGAGGGAIALPASAAICGFATNGAGVAIACFSNATNVLYTNNFGQSWSLIAHNLGALPSTDVIWNGSRFIVVGNSTTSLAFAYSITGAVFTVGGTAGLTSATANTARIAWDGTIAIAVVGATTQAASTPDGVTITARTISQAIAQPLIAVLPSLGVNRWYVTCSNNAATSSQSSAADGSAWVNRACPNAAGVAAIAAGLGYIALGSGASIWRSTTGADGSWILSTIPSANLTGSGGVGGISISFPLSLTFDGARFLIGSVGQTSVSPNQFGYTADLVSFTTRQFAFAGASASGALGYAPLSFGSNVALLPVNIVGYVGTQISTAATYSANWFFGSEYVGSVVPIYNQPSAILGGVGYSRLAPGYVRIK